jgi:signal transduction histidine kinase
MTMLSRLNSIAVRIAIAIVFAIILGLLMLVVLSLGFSYYGYGQGGGDGAARDRLVVSKTNFGIINPRRNLMMLSGKIALIIRSAASASRLEQERIVASIVDPEMQVVLDGPERPGAVGSSDGYTESLRQLIEMQLEAPSLPVSISAFSLPGDDEPAEFNRSRSTSRGMAVIEAALQNGRRLTFTVPHELLGGAAGLILFLISIAIVSALVSIWMARRIAAPIREFAGAAERLGLDLTAPPLVERGPQEMRATIQAVNRMQYRLQRFLEDRTQMLAAISHDLRAPLARLRLRAELVSDGEQQRKMFDDLDSMNAMIESTLAFARDDARQEPRTLVDLGVLVGDVCEDAGDAGDKVAYTGQRGIDVSCRPTPVRRAVANLVDNAVKYGGSARVRIVLDVGRVTIVVDDDGPGIPSEEHEKVFAPFYRREPARDPARSGVGLGLSIARTVAREHGGDVTLNNRDGGGLTALIELPV